GARVVLQLFVDARGMLVAAALHAGLLPPALGKKIFYGVVLGVADGVETESPRGVRAILCSIPPVPEGPVRPGPSGRFGLRYGPGHLVQGAAVPWGQASKGGGWVAAQQERHAQAAPAHRRRGPADDRPGG